MYLGSLGSFEDPRLPSKAQDVKLGSGYGGELEGGDHYWSIFLPFDLFINVGGGGGGVCI